MGLLGRYASFQLIAQALGFLSNLLIIRALSIPDYAVFTLAFTFTTMGTILSDSGTGAALSAVGGQVCTNPRRFSELVATALKFRRNLELLVFLVAVPALAWMLLRQHSGLLKAGVATLLTAVTIHAQIGAGVMVIVVRLQLRLKVLQHSDILLSALRLTLVAAATAVSGGYALVLLAGAIATMLQSRFLQYHAYKVLDRTAPANDEDRRVLLLAFKHTALAGLYFVLQSQITVWLMSMFGGTQGVADVGALGRLGSLFTPAIAILNNIALPRFARYTEAALIRRRYLQTVGATLAIALVLFMGSAIFPTQLLWLLGPKYAHLRNELPLMFAASSAFLVVNTVAGLNAVRGWVRGYWVYVPLTLATQVGLLMILNVSTVRGALLLSIFSLLPLLLVNLALTYRGLRGEGLVANGGRRDSAGA